MRITKKDLKEMIVDILTEQGAPQQTLPDIEKLKNLLGHSGADEHISNRIDNEKEFINLINTITSMVDPNKIPLERQLELLRKAVTQATGKQGDQT
tara:strand:+ start:334 stop:621 length:288 start_codon:yes stop_codon:yes gene_type:complete